MQRGRSLSQPGTGGQTASGDDSGVDARLKKDPVGSYSYGSSPSRYPSIVAPYAAGGQNPNVRAAPTATLGAGLGSIPKYTPGQLPTLQRGNYGNSYAAPLENTDPSARTYDPSKQSTNSYGR